MTPRPVRVPSQYISVDRIASTRDSVVQLIGRRQQRRDPEGLCREVLREALVDYGVDYREIADLAGVSGLDVLQILTELDTWNSSPESALINDRDSAVYRAALATERASIEEYLDQVVSAQRDEVVRLLDANLPLATVAREMGIPRTTARKWYEEVQKEASEAADSHASDPS
ncbi:hypothetical protein GS896_25435 [Rhodococcus hoagii]|nr:hypothetical protein [Prescottella equi]MBM4654152.1 hypothetical protein [Prescottella equi]MBM4719625.1 hypothetical protein [Prescottella equi]NKR23423.1 hypothetical protein [Prescottella equi]NKT55965.1 hypothetical protein [Prescottella equi]